MKTACVLLFLGFAAFVPLAHAQPGWPTRPVRVIVPFPPGGNTDVIARMVSPRLAEEYGQQFVVDNRGGAGGTVGAEILIRANPDGHTIIVVASTYASSAALYKLPYDPVQGISPVSLITTGPLVLGSNLSVKASSLKELIELARAKPGALNFASSGTGSVPHLATELFRQMAKLDMVHVPYKGDTPALADLLGGHVQLFISSPLAMIPQIKAGKIRGMAVTTAQRSPVLPDLPAIGELVPGYAVSSWFGMCAPAGTPRDVVSRLNQSLARIVKQPDVQARLRADGVEPAHTTPGEFRRFIGEEITKWSKVVKAGNIKVE
ncbi:MAG: tripartite tricarboxylate transporter substrate binding protein [Burkholderiales bacterium]